MDVSHASRTSQPEEREKLQERTAKTGEKEGEMVIYFMFIIENLVSTAIIKRSERILSHSLSRNPLKKRVFLKQSKHGEVKKKTVKFTTQREREKERDQPTHKINSPDNFHGLCVESKSFEYFRY